MILILSDVYDKSTSKVIDYLKYFNKPYFRINGSDRIFLKIFEIFEDKTSFQLVVNASSKKTIIDSKEIEAFWYRRGHFIFELDRLKNESNNNKIEKGIENYIKNEKHDLIWFLHLFFSSIHSLGFYFDNDTNKLYNLLLASKSGLKIPYTTVISDKENLKRVIKEKNKVIVKAIKNGGFSISNDFAVGAFTELIEQDQLKDFPEIFAPTLIQEYIEKEVELRIFYLDEKCFAAAIFSQNDDKTKIDFRNYNESRPNRIIPFNLPQKIESKIIAFMKAVNLKTGSLDFIYSKMKEFVFLEVNPIGQYDFISNKCNFYLDKEIAKYLMNYEK